MPDGTSQDRDAAAQHARAMFERSGYYCAQSVLLAIAHHQGIASELLPAISTGFCSGLAHTHGPCGALTGGVMGLGLINGMRAPGDPRQANYAAVQRFVAAFVARFGATDCLTLTGCDLGTPEGQAQYRAQQVGARCLDYVQEATRLALIAADPSAGAPDRTTSGE